MMTATTSPLDEALYYAARSWRVVPVVPRAKRPVLDQWTIRATTDPTLIREWWGRWPDHGVGIVTGADSGIFVLDVDPQHGGDDTLADLEHEHAPLPDTIETITGGGGRHIIFRWPGWNPGTGAGQLGPGLDIRAEGGFIVAPPTIHPTGRPYAWELMHDPHDGLAPLEAPDWLLELLAPTARVELEPRAATVDHDGLPDWHTLLTQAGATYTGTRTRRDTGTTYELWTRPGKPADEGCSATLGYTPADNLRIFTSNWPPYHDGEHVTRFRFYANLNGWDDQQARNRLDQHQQTRALADLRTHDWPATEPASTLTLPAEIIAAEPAPSRTEHIRQRIYTYSQLAEIPPPEWLIHGWVMTNSLALVHGPPGHGKSFLAVDWAAHIATGSHWNGQPTSQGPVLYILAEGTSGVHSRLTSWATYHQTQIPDSLLTHPSAIDIADPSWAEPLAEVAGEIEPKLVIVDTLARNMLSGDENSTKDMGAFIAGLDKIRERTKACVLTIHHQSRAGNIRGAIALEGAMDTIVQCTQDGTTISVEMAPPAGKQKDAEPAEGIALERRIVGSSCVLAPWVPTEASLSPAMRQIVTFVAETDMSEMGVDSVPILRGTGIPRSTFYRHVEHLVKLQILTRSHEGRNTLLALTDLGKQIYKSSSVSQSHTVPRT